MTPADLPPLPEPCGSIVWWTNESKRKHAESAAAFSKEVMQAYAKLAVREALELAAVECEATLVRDGFDSAFRCAANVRAMIKEYE